MWNKRNATIARTWLDKYWLKLIVHDESNVICYSKDSQIYYAAGRHSSVDVSSALDTMKTHCEYERHIYQFRNRLKWMNTISVAVKWLTVIYLCSHTLCEHLKMNFHTKSFSSYSSRSKLSKLNDNDDDFVNTFCTGSVDKVTN